MKHIGSSRGGLNGLNEKRLFPGTAEPSNVNFGQNAYSIHQPFRFEQFIVLN